MMRLIEVRTKRTGKNRFQVTEVYKGGKIENPFGTYDCDYVPEALERLSETFWNEFTLPETKVTSREIVD